MQFRRFLLIASVSLFFILGSPFTAQAGLLELMSQGAAGLTGNVCADFEEDNAGRVLRKIDQECKDDRVLGITNTHYFSAVLNEIEDDSEDNYFALLANQHARELN